ncbi:hypothetical protein NPIL_160721 [Nephila pilipes]|uniref:Uncharacterized protein n=1 Tax=Nephila pilipes TaxID=299642 RepID=A0A8X6T2K5_NEPPI|nr:hypothetical protein NPIL_160721 [Nephila pilipes]
MASTDAGALVCAVGGLRVHFNTAIVDGRGGCDNRLVSVIGFKDAGLHAAETYAIPVIVSVCLKNEINHFVTVENVYNWITRISHTNCIVPKKNPANFKYQILKSGIQNRFMLPRDSL